jgi:hypothetical protein
MGELGWIGRWDFDRLPRLEEVCVPTVCRGDGL